MSKGPTMLTRGILLNECVLYQKDAAEFAKVARDYLSAVDWGVDRSRNWLRARYWQWKAQCAAAEARDLFDLAMEYDAE